MNICSVFIILIEVVLFQSISPLPINIDRENNTSILTEGNIDNSCSQGWLYSSETQKCYKLSNPGNISDIHWECGIYIAQILSIESDEENQFLLDNLLLKSDSKLINIGLYKGENETNYTWYEKETLNFTNWQSGLAYIEQLDDDEKCAAIIANNENMPEWEIGKWVEVSCKLELPGICEIPLKKKQVYTDLYCGANDNELENIEKWEKHHLNYFIKSYSHNMDTMDIEWILNRAFTDWNYVVHLKFSRVEAIEKADIVINFFRGDQSYDENQLAYCDGKKQCSSIYINDNKKWKVVRPGRWLDYSEIGFTTVIMHQIGHAIGLPHINGRNYIMNRQYIRPENNKIIVWSRIKTEEIRAIQDLYGLTPIIDKSYIGCFTYNDLKFFNSINYGHFDINSPFYCMKTCLENNFLYAGVEFHSECYCGHKEDLQAAKQQENASICHKYRCFGDHNRFCGGDKAVDVYTTEKLDYLLNPRSTIYIILINKSEAFFAHFGLSLIVGIIMVIMILIVLIASIAILAFYYYLRKKNALLYIQLPMIRLITKPDLKWNPSNCLGRGYYGQVYKGTYIMHTNEQAVRIKVAIKILNNDLQHNEEFFSDLKNEASNMARLKHDHILPLLGICMDQPIQMVMDFRKYGSLFSYLRDPKNENLIKPFHQLLYCKQISSAMEYLTKEGIVHGDLAARNVLVRSKTHVEVTDFGLSQLIGGIDMDKELKLEQLPTPWLPPECLKGPNNKAAFSEKSDVWAFGVTCWEIITYALLAPYIDVTPYLNPKAYEFVAHLLEYLDEKSLRLEQPVNCHADLYSTILIHCWNSDPQQRLKFEKLTKIFANYEKHPEHNYITNGRDKIKMKFKSSTSLETKSSPLYSGTSYMSSTGMSNINRHMGGRLVSGPWTLEEHHYT